MSARGVAVVSAESQGERAVVVGRLMSQLAALYTEGPWVCVFAVAHAGGVTGTTYIRSDIAHASGMPRGELGAKVFGAVAAAVAGQLEDAGLSGGVKCSGDVQ